MKVVILRTAMMIVSQNAVHVCFEFCCTIKSISVCGGMHACMCIHTIVRILDTLRCNHKLYAITDLLEFAEDLLCDFGNSDGSDEEYSDDNVLSFLSDDESDTEYQYSPGMLLESHSFLPFSEQMDEETGAFHSTPLYDSAPLSCGKLASNNGLFASSSFTLHCHGSAAKAAEDARSISAQFTEVIEQLQETLCCR